MKTFIITYDLGSPETKQSYIDLGNLIKKNFSTWARPVRSVWIIKSASTATSIRDLIKGQLDLNDKLMVVELGDGWGTYNISREVTDWMHKNM